MTNKDQCDKFATDMAGRFEDFTKWAIENWPDSGASLLPSDFSESRKEIARILGDKLSASQLNKPPPDNADSSAQYVQMNPMPWP